MPKYVDREALEDLIDRSCGSCFEWDALDEMSIDIVKCEDCIHYYADPWGWGNCVFEGGVSRRTKKSDFCSWGERKEDGDNH
jgi:hypothetical protein